MLKDIKKLTSETLIYGISTVLTRLINFFLVPLYTHYLSPDEYGRVSTIFSLIAFLNIFYVLGLNHGYMRFKSNDSLSNTFSFIFLWGFLLSILVMIFANFFTYLLGIEEVNLRLVFYSALIVYLDAIVVIPFTDLRMEHKALIFVTIRSLSILLNIILNFVFLRYSKAGIDGVFWAAIVSSFSQVIFLNNYFKYFSFRLNISSMRDIFSYSFPYVPSSLSNVSIQILDRPIMMHLLDPYSVGIYQANFRLGVFMNMVVSMFDFAWRPFVIENMNKENAKEIFKKVFLYFSFFMIYIFLVLSLFIEYIIKIPIGSSYLINPNYWSGIGIVSIIMLGYIFMGFYIFFMIGSIITKKTIYSMKANLFASSLSIILNFILIPFYGIYGAAYSFLISNIFLAIYMYLVNENKLLKVKYDIKKVLIQLFVAIFFIYLFKKVYFTQCYIIQMKIFISLMYPFIFIIFGYFEKEDIEKIRRKIISILGL